MAADAALDAASARARAAAADRDAAIEELNRQTAAIAPLLPLMTRLGLWPAETLLAVPTDPETALRGTLVLRGLARQVAAEAAALRAAQQKAATASGKAEQEGRALAEARDEARAAAAEVEAALAVARTHRTAAQAEAAAAAKEAAAAAARTADIRGVLEKLEEERKRAEAEARARAAREQAAAERAAQREAEALAARQRAARDAEARAAIEREREALATRETARQEAAARAPTPPPETRGGRAVPVAGRLTRDFGDAAAGGPARGLTYAAPPGARVVSPCGGRAVFSGPFRSYGLLLIVDCGNGYHFVLAGLERLDAEAGSRLLAGEPVGVLGGGDSGEGGRASLYVELRRNGQAVDPKGWFRARS
ncbi:peptidase M23 [Pseudoroseomonas wenyumeiae]|uniref:Peptidase M23 n=1 Tax=Teichococcus wenyumeiae TaxID=2478470 RepID=A0ABX9VJR5_9PROT|nr:peptidase M23 [Pseudoroseomonas wenyumeiae]